MHVRTLTLEEGGTCVCWISSPGTCAIDCVRGTPRGVTMKLHYVPHLVLGVTSAATPDEASVGFARAAKRVKRMEDPPFSVEDLTSALALIEGSGDDSLTFSYCLPANPDVLKNWDISRAEAAVAQAEQDAEQAALGSLQIALNLLLQWKWAEAESSAKDALRLSHVEAVRDEALNLLALALAMRNEDGKAIAALKQAVEGEWNLALQQNLGILAMENDPELAVTQATFWLESAQTVEERESALFRVLGMWMSLQEDAEDDDDDEAPLPPRLRDSLRRALTEDLSRDTFQSLGTFLARRDRDWIIKPSNWARSVHGNSVVANLVLARAEGFGEYMDYLVENTNNPTAAIQSEINSLIQGMNQLMIREDDAIGPASVCIGLFDKGLDYSNFERVLARPLTVREICLSVSEDDGEPVEKVLDWLEAAKDATAKLDISAEAREMLNDILGSAGNLVSAIYHDSRLTDAQRVQENLMEINSLHSYPGGRRRIDRNGLRRAAHSMQTWVLDTKRIHGKCLRLMTDDDLKQAWAQLITGVNQLEANIRNYL